MSSRRLDSGGAIDRTVELGFSFDGSRYTGHPGDTLASALLAAGVRTVGRSVKYHRPRGVWGAWVEEPNAIFDLVQAGVRTPNCRATTTPLAAEVQAFSVIASPSAERDRHAWIDRFARFIPAAFYYKTFMWPNWHWFEPRIREMAGLGRADPDFRPEAIARQRHAKCELLVVGAGVAGLACARAAAERGHDVLLVDDRASPGGMLGDTGETVEGVAGAQWARDSAAAFSAAGGRYLASTTAFGIYDHNLVLCNQIDPLRGPDSLWRVRAKRIVLATGAIERPLTFPDNDRPGVMSAHAALAYLNRYGVLVGDRIVVATNNSSTTEVARSLIAAGAEVTLLDSREEPDTARVPARGKSRVRGLDWRDGLRSVHTDRGESIDADALLVSGGWTPSVHLHCQAGGKLDWRDDLLAFVPRPGIARIDTVGAAAGEFTVDEALASGAGAGSGAGTATPASRRAYDVQPAWPRPGAEGRQWVDFQSDVTTGDIELAARENFVSIEHLKRYTTLGMATDQGKTSGIVGLATMAAISGRPIASVGTTTYRPPFVPVPLSSFAGTRRGECFAPIKRLPLESAHRADGAVFREYGGWLRPAYYGTDGDGTDSAVVAIQREARAAREGVALFDASPLGKIEVFGPDAERFIDFVYYNTMATLKPGRIRYGFMLNESGSILDDGVLCRIAANHFVVSCSSSHVEAVAAMLDTWRQDQFDARRIFIQDSTAQWATLTLTGPKSRQLLARLHPELDLDDESFAHMSFVERDSTRISRVSFTGDRSYEITVACSQAATLWARLKAAGAELGASLLGLEGLSILRAEKGLIIIGKDTDGQTMPHDLGFAGPREKKAGEFIGKRGLFTEEASRSDRHVLVGLETDGEALAAGAHIVHGDGPRRSSQGFVTSSYVSPNLGRPIALALLRNGRARVGEAVSVFHLGKTRAARVAPPCAFDPRGERINA
ncbi:MAG: (2Fe-2S)-binding protein [Burkholderiaceae bacterium]|nr:(2Fe-2S)-binding protein [Burkholderiaceae bacterium]